MAIHQLPIPRSVLMPIPDKASYSNEEVEAEVARRISARDRALRDAGFEQELKALREEIQRHSRDRQSVVTKDIFENGLAELRAWINSNYVRITDSFTSDQRLALRAMADEYVQQLKRRENQRKWHETIWGRAGIAAGILVSLIQIIEFIFAVRH